MSKLEMSTDILEALQKLSSLLDSEDAFELTLHTVVDLSVATLPGCDSAAVTIRREGRDTTAAASDSYALEIDNIQYRTRQGPCLSAVETGEVQRIHAVSEGDDWPEFRRRAADSGFRSGASFPLRMNGTAAALNLYSRSEGAIDDATVEIGTIFARQASIALHNAAIFSAARRLGDQLTEALKTRDMIGQAKGILMEREGVSDAEAFDMLRTVSQSANEKLREVARRVIEENVGKV